MWPVPTTSIPDLVIKALAPAIPQKVRAGHFGDSCSDFIAGKVPRTNEDYILLEGVTGGYGGKPFEDGECNLHSMDLGDTYNIPVEIIEQRYPLRVERYELIRDSAGPGKYRGGLASRKDYSTVWGDTYITSTVDRAIYSPPWGLFGGKSGKPSGSIFYRKNGRVEHWRKFRHLLLRVGETYSIVGGGGGGYGDPLEREPDLVRRDVMNEYVSLEKAREEYGVVFRKNHEVDLERTMKLRLSRQKKN
jgi:N-methylhydantoinase B